MATELPYPVISVKHQVKTEAMDGSTRRERKTFPCRKLYYYSTPASCSLQSIWKCSGQELDIALK